MRCLVVLHLFTFIVLHVLALCPTLLILADFDKGFTDVIAVGILLTIASFLDRKFFSSKPVELLFEQPVYSRPLEEEGGGGGVCTLKRAVFLEFASIGTLQYGSR